MSIIVPSYSHGVSDTPLLGQTIGQNLYNTVLKYPHNEALVCPEHQYRATYQEFWNQTTTIAKSLLAYGFQKGDRVGIWSPNRYEWVLIQYATARIGVILVNINPAYRCHELEYVLNQAGIKMLVAATHFKSSDYRSIVGQIDMDKSCGCLQKAIFLGEEWEAFVNAPNDISDEQLKAVEDSIQFDDPVNIQYTSGTTGFPKGVTLSHSNIQNNGFFIGERLNYTENDKVCIPVPFYHCFGMVIGNLACTSHGATMVIPSEGFDPAITLQTVQDEKCTSLYGVPTMFIAALGLSNFSDYDLSSLRTGVMAGSPCPVEIMKRVQSQMNMNEVSVCYGMTETSPVSCQTKIGVALDKQVSTVGTVMDHLEVKVINPETGAILPRGQKGELCTRGYSVMLKYWNQPDATAKVKDEGGWMHTGDEAMMDEEGYITITGRIKDLIIRGGENISPKEIEDFLYTHPAILDVQVIGVPDVKFGEQVMAWVILKEGLEVSPESLKEYCQQQIAHYKVPKYWKFVTSFPMTITGKIRKIEMREISVKELGL